MRLEYFDINGRALLARNLLDFCKVEYEDKRLTQPEFGQGKREGKYTYGQVPALFLDDGTPLTQSISIARYIGRNYRGPNGEQLYPTRDADTCYQIELLI